MLDKLSTAVFSWIDQQLRDIGPPQFSDQTEERITQALCTMAIGEERCAPSFPYFNAARTFFRALVAKESIHVTSKVDGDAIAFQVGDEDYNLFCGAGTCSLSQYREIAQADVRRSEEGIVDSVVGAPLSLLGMGCSESSAPAVFDTVNIATFTDVPIKEPAPYSETFATPVVFCSWYGLGDDTCWSQEAYITNKISECLYITGIYDNNGVLINGLSDFANFMAYLANHTHRFSMRLAGDNVWPSGYFDKAIPMAWGNPDSISNNWYRTDGDDTHEVYLNESVEDGVMFLGLIQEGVCVSPYVIPCDTDYVSPVYSSLKQCLSKFH